MRSVREQHTTGGPGAAADRLRVRHATGLPDGTPASSLDRLTAMARRLTGARAAIVSLVDVDGHRFAGGPGLPGELAPDWGTPFCRAVVAGEAPLVVEDARLHDPSIADHDVVAYAGFPLRAPGGHVLGSFCVIDDRARRWTDDDLETVRDLAAAAETEIALRLAHGELLRSSARTRTVLDGAADAYVSTDDAGLVLAWNCAAEKLFGYRSAEAVGRPVTELFVPQRFRGMYEAGMAQLRATGGSRLSGRRLQLSVVDRTGREFPVEATLQIVLEQGRPVAHAFLHDVTARVIAGRELDRQRRAIEDERTFLQALLDSLDTGVVACDADGRLAFFNRALREVHGADAAPQAPGETWAQSYDLYAADGRTPLPADEVPLARAYRGEQVRGQHLVVRPAGRAPRRFVANARPIDTADGRRLGAVAAMHEITDVPATRPAALG